MLPSALIPFNFNQSYSGLGAGISATAFIRHGLSTTIVEIDPAVYDAARSFFGLPNPGPGKVFLEDARSWAAQKRASVEAGNKETLYDIVIHDCFSGGGVPEHIFTMEFWNDLKAVIQPEGVVVVVSVDR
jgi:spermidine synthase